MFEFYELSNVSCVVKIFDSMILKLLMLWKVSITSEVSGPRLVVNCHSSESAIKSALSSAVKIRPFGSVSGWNDYDLFRRDLLCL